MRPAAEVTEILASCPPALRKRLLALRTLIFETAREIPGVGRLEETLKWNEPAYLTSESKSGSTIRINRLKGSQSRYAMYFNCNSGLVDSFRSLYPKVFRFQGDRAIEFDIEEKVPVKELKQCIAMALTHHLSKSQKKKPK